MIRKLLIVYALVTAASAFPAAAQTPFESLKLKDICTKHPTRDAYIVDLDQLACRALGASGLCKGDERMTSEVRQKYFTSDQKYDDLSWKRILRGTNPDFKLIRLPRCASGKAEREMLTRSNCLQITCERYAGANSDSKVSPGILDSIRIRSDASELWKPTAFKPAPAKISLLRDFDSGGNTFSVKGALGYAVKLYTAGDGNNPVKFIPYVAVERFESRTKPDVTNISAGTRLTYEYFPTRRQTDWGHFFDADVNLLTDEEADSLVLDGSLIYTPLPDYDLFKSGFRMASLRLRADASAILEFGEVFDPGTKAKLRTTKNYLRGGGQIHLVLDSVTVDPALAFLRNFTFRLRYKYLHGFEGPVESLEQFEAALEYKITSDGKFGFELKYFDGQLDTTLDDREYFLGAFTVRF